MSDQTPGPANLRARLSRLPRLDDEPLDSAWLHEAGPEADEYTDIGAHDVDDVELLPPHGDHEPRRRRRRRRWPIVLALFLGALALVIAVPVITAYRAFDSIERVPVRDALAPPVDGRNILLIGTDSRAGIDTTVENSGAILGGGTEGERSDTILILRIGDDGSRHLLSLPRDLWLPIDGGGEQRINTAIARGPDALIRTVTSELGIPITNYIEVDLAGFIDVVDAIGGVRVTIPHPAFDRSSGLHLPEAGEVTLDSTQALAYVRSRRYVEVVDGVERSDPTSDLGRVRRQQAFLRGLIEELTSERNPLTANQIIDATADAVRMDDALSFRDAADLALDLRAGLPESVEVPTVPATIGGRSVLLLGEGADDVLRLFGAGPST